MAAAADEPETTIIDNNTWEYHRQRIGSVTMNQIRLIIKDGPGKVPVNTFVSLVRNCNVSAQFMDTFLGYGEPLVDDERLSLLLGGHGIYIYRFYGWLSAGSIPRIPMSVTELGLVVDTPQVMTAIGNITPWALLSEIRLNLTPAIGLEDMVPMPRTLRQVGLYFSSLDDTRVHIVAPAIIVLVPRMELSGLYFPDFQCSLTGVMDLGNTVPNIPGLRIRYAFYIEPRGPWIPNEVMKEQFKKQIIPALTIPDFQWDMEKIYRH